jgi:hypothetical protein
VPSQLLYNRSNEVLKALRGRLATMLNWHVERILIAAAGPEDCEHLASEQDIVLKAGHEGEAPGGGEGGFEGGGRYVMRRQRDVAIYPRTRVWLDEAPQDAVHITDASLGHWALEDLIIDYVQAWFALDSSLNAISEPFVCKGIGEPARDHRDKGWISSRIDCAFVYERLVTLAEIA